MSVLVARSSGLLAPFDPPELTIEQAIERGWERRADGRLMEPKPDEYLPAYPLTFSPRRPWADPWSDPWPETPSWLTLTSGIVP
jgi:hypothetical protein